MVVVAAASVILHLVLGETAQEAPDHGADEAVALLLSEVVACPGSPQATEEAAVLFAHGRGVGIVVGCVGVGRLGSDLWRFLTILSLTGLAHGRLIGLVLSICILAGATVLLMLLWLIVPIIVGVALRIAGPVRACLPIPLAVLEAPGSGRAEGVGAARRCETWIGRLRGIALLLRRILLIALLERITGLLSVPLLRRVALLVTLIIIVWTRHCRRCRELRVRKKETEIDGEVMDEKSELERAYISIRLCNTRRANSPAAPEARNGRPRTASAEHAAIGCRGVAETAEPELSHMAWRTAIGQVAQNAASAADSPADLRERNCSYVPMLPGDTLLTFVHTQPEMAVHWHWNVLYI